MTVREDKRTISAIRHWFWGKIWVTPGIQEWELVSGMDEARKVLALKAIEELLDDDFISHGRSGGYVVSRNML